MIIHLSFQIQLIYLILSWDQKVPASRHRSNNFSFHVNYPDILARHLLEKRNIEFCKPVSQKATNQRVFAARTRIRWISCGIILVSLLGPLIHRLRLSSYFSCVQRCATNARAHVCAGVQGHTHVRASAHAYGRVSARARRPVKVEGFARGFCATRSLLSPSRILVRL